MSQAQLVDGLVIIALRIRNEDARALVIHELTNFGEQVTSNIFELQTAHWDSDTWEERMRLFEAYLEGTGDRMIIWKFVGQTYTRFTIHGSG